MRTKILAAFLAGGLLVGAGFLTSVISAPGTARAQEEIEDDDGGRPLAGPFRILGEVLDDLVDNGTITGDQADAITDAVRDKTGELRERRRDWLEDGRGHLRHHFRNGFRLGALLDDGGIDESEYEDLGEDHPLKRLDVDVDEYLDDGLITPVELREIFQDLKDSRTGDNA